MKRILKVMITIGTLALSSAGSAAASNGESGHDNKIERRGTIEAIAADSVTVRQTSFAIVPETKFEDQQSQPADPALFIVGSVVEVSGRIINGVLTAREIELKSGAGSPGDGNNGNTAPRKKSKLKARLYRTDPLSAAAASSDYRYESRRNRSEERFSIELKLPVPSAVPAAGTIDSAAGLQLQAVLSRGGSPYATCALELDKIKERRRKIRSEFKVDVREKNNLNLSAFVERRGQCDIHPEIDGVQTGIPTVEAGDLITIQALTEGGTVPVLAGSFRRGH